MLPEADPLDEMGDQFVGFQGHGNQNAQAYSNHPEGKGENPVFLPLVSYLCESGFIGVPSLNSFDRSFYPRPGIIRVYPCSSVSNAISRSFHFRHSEF